MVWAVLQSVSTSVKGVRSGLAGEGAWGALGWAGGRGVYETPWHLYVAVEGRERFQKEADAVLSKVQ